MQAVIGLVALVVVPGQFLKRLF